MTPGKNTYRKKTQIKNLIENNFEQMGHIIYHHRIKTLLALFILIGALVSQLPKLSIDTSFEGMLHEDDPGRIMYNNFRDQFGRDELIVIAVKSPEIFNVEFLKKLKAFHEALENEVPYLQEVRNLVNARDTYGESDLLIVNKLLKDFPEEPIDPEWLKERVLGNPVYVNNFISEDGKLTALLLETIAIVKESEDAEDILKNFGQEDTLSSDTSSGSSPGTSPGISDDRHYFSEKETKVVVEAVYQVADRYKSDDFLLYYTGGPVIEDATNRIIRHDMSYLTALTYSVMIFFLALLFRRISGVIIPLVIVFASVISTFCLMAIFNVPITQAAIILPTILSAIGIADAIHVLAIFFRHLQQGNSKEDAIAFALGHSGLAILMTSLTTSAGFFH